jgi:hypothetical protein
VAFTRTADDPFSGAIVATNAVYILALQQVLPGEIPPLTNVLAKVTEDYRMSVALAAARHAGEGFAVTVTNGQSNSTGFANAAKGAKGVPETLTPFSLSTSVTPEAVKGRAGMEVLKEWAFATPVGQSSRFVPTEDGGFVIYVAAKSPVDEAKLKKELPEFLAYLRRARENEAVNQWFNREIQRDADLIQSLKQALENSAENRSRPMPRPKP